MTSFPAPGEESGAVRPLVVLGDPGAAVCDGDVCYLPSVRPSGAGAEKAGQHGPDAQDEQPVA